MSDFRNPVVCHRCAGKGRESVYDERAGRWSTHMVTCGYCRGAGLIEKEVDPVEWEMRITGESY